MSTYRIGVRLIQRKRYYVFFPCMNNRVDKPPHSFYFIGRYKKRLIAQYRVKQKFFIFFDVLGTRLTVSIKKIKRAFADGKIKPRIFGKEFNGNIFFRFQRKNHPSIGEMVVLFRTQTRLGMFKRNNNLFLLKTQPFTAFHNDRYLLPFWVIKIRLNTKIRFGC